MKDFQWLVEDATSYETLKVEKSQDLADDKTYSCMVYVGNLICIHVFLTMCEWVHFLVITSGSGNNTSKSITRSLSLFISSEWLTKHTI